MYPKGWAVYATEENVAKFRTVVKETENGKSSDDKRKRAKLLHKLMNATTIIKRNSEDGKTCHPGEVTAQNIVDKLLKQHRIVIDVDRLSLPENEHAIKELGEFSALYHLEDEDAEVLGLDSGSVVAGEAEGEGQAAGEANTVPLGVDVQRR
mmetsp:Transcript_71905/g.203701  ORF Transcript_71905/g.203701 Transcript_71905/m.203701 type:complete len:152 (+) Transcript_71905:407-862(+)